MSAIDLSWEPPGPISQRFMGSRARVQIINGPVGSGKTTSCFMKAVRLAMMQAPTPGYASPRAALRGKPIRQFKLTVMRDDYRQLWRSTVPSWNSRFPQSFGKWSGAINAPARHELDFVLDDGTAVEFIAEFVALGDNDVEEFMRGYEPTAFYLNELDLLAREVLAQARFRWGRYPRTIAGQFEPTWYGCLADCNAPIIDSWLYNDIFLDSPADVELFRLPGAFDPGAENLQNLPRDYYQGHIAGADQYLIRRMVHNQPAPSRSGKPVHEDFNDFLHVAPRELEPIPGLPLYIGFDAGLDPCAAIGQKLGNGHWHIIDELVTPHGTGAVHFARLLNEHLAERYPGWHALPGMEERPAWSPRERPAMIRAWCDPAATYGGDEQSAADADRTWCELVAYHTGIRITPAPTNNTTERRAGLQRVLTLITDRKPAFQLSPRCKMIRAGLAGQFRYRRMQIAREERYADEVDKNAHSHPCEALEYLMLGGGEGAEVHERRQRGWDVRNLPREAADDWRMGG